MTCYVHPHFVLTGNLAVCRSVISQSTTLEERTGAFANFSIAQGVGFAIGPGQVVLFLFERFMEASYHD